MMDLPIVLLSAALSLCAENGISPCTDDALGMWAIRNGAWGGCGFGEPETGGRRCASVMCRQNPFGPPHDDRTPILIATFQTYHGDWGWRFICLPRADLIS